MIHKIVKKKDYIRPEAEATWMDNEDLMQTIGGSAPDEPWGNAKASRVIPVEVDEREPEDDSWGMYFSHDFDE